LKEIQNKNFENKELFDTVGLILEEITYRMFIFNTQVKEVSDIMNTWTTREKYLDVIIQLSVHCARQEITTSKEQLEEQLAKKQDICLAKRKELEFILQESKKEFPKSARFGTKLEHVLRDIVEIRKEEPETKMLVFSQWNEALSQLASLLQENGVKFVSAKMIPEVVTHGSVSERIKEFKENPETVVCLLNTAKQATGLTLTQANHVFIMDVVDNANDMQAIGRIHRIGQNKATFVHRYIFNEETHQTKTVLDVDALEE
jgi:SNF2 family DNA or RNA helicase